MDHFTVAWEKGDAIIRAMANECPYPPDDSIQQAVINMLSKSNLYPEDPTGAKVLREKIAKYCGVDKENITIGNGSMEILDIVFRLFLEPGANILTSLPDYTAYRVRPALFGGGVITSPSADDLSIRIDSILNKIDSTIRLIILSRPHNPSGTILPRSDVIRLLETNLPVFVDEAYIELSDMSNSLVGLIPKYNNLLISRTFSKGFGLAGFRIGYLIANPKIIEYANRAKPSMNVNLLAQTAAHAALDNIERSLINAKKVKQVRQWLFNELSKIPGLKPIPSEANFIMIDCTNTGLTSRYIVDALLKKNIFVRDYSNSTGIPPDIYFRITVGQKEQMQQILQALKDILNKGKNIKV
jgi:histidinol-phosphate aminotransferase